jgi:hypothetical protein
VSQVVFLEVVLKTSGGVMAGLFMLITPRHNEDVGYSAEHPHDPQVMGTADAKLGRKELQGKGVGF